MYPINAPAVYVHERAAADARCMARVERMMACITCPDEPQVVDDAALNDLSAAHGWSGMTGVRTGEIKRSGDPIVIFNSFRWATQEQFRAMHERYPHLRHYYLSGAGAWTFRDGVATLETQSGVCTNAYELHSAWGCLHVCDYCNVLDFLNLMVNLEELAHQFERLALANPWLQLWKYDNHTDTITFEPEYGASEILVDLFSRLPGRWLMLYTKSANVDHLLGLDHRGKTIICWSLAADTQSRLIEKKAATTTERIEAARKCRDAGFPVRARLSPIVPVRGWADEGRAMLEQLLAAVTPDVLTLDTLKWTEPTRVWGMFDRQLWDEEYAGYVDLYASMPPAERPHPVLPNGKQLFSHEARMRLYRPFVDTIRRLSPTTRIAFCGETPEIWAAFRDDVRMTPDNYVCACGPASVSGNPLFGHREG